MKKTELRRSTIKKLPDTYKKVSKSFFILI